MTRVDASFPEPLADLLEAACDEGLFKGPSDAARVATYEYFADDRRRLDAVTALIQAQPSTDDEEALSLADVVRLSHRLPAELPEEIRTHYEFPSESVEDNSTQNTKL